MEFRIAKTEFLRGLRLAQGIADRKSTMPMLANVLLRTQGKNQLLVAATDLNVSLTAELKSHNASDGGIAILAKSLLIHFWHTTRTPIPLGRSRGANVSAAC